MHVSGSFYTSIGNMWLHKARLELRHLCLVLLLVATLQGYVAQRLGPIRHPIYTFRTARADDDSFDSYSRYRSQPYYSSSNVRFPANSGSTVSTKLSTSSYLTSTNPMVIRHPNSCSYDRSHAACTFSLLCYLANGVPVEGCEDNSSMTCCYLNSKTPPSHTSTSNPSTNIVVTSNAKSDQPRTVNTIYRQYPSAPSVESTSQVSSVTYRSPASFHAASNAISNYYNPSSSYGESNGQFVDYKQHKQDLLALYESKSQGVSKLDSDYLSNTIRRTRTDNYKSIFQEIANRKLYARNYDVEDICGKPTAKPRSRIIGGQSAYFGEFPWQVHIKITKHQCGGALINSQFIVTAAHCIYQAPIHQLNVIIGAHDIEDPRFQDIPPQYFSVSKVILHPNFRFSASHPDRYDIALLKLDKTVRFSDSVLPVCLPEENIQFEGWTGIVTGWGKTDPALSNRYGTRLLQKVEVPIVDNKKCEIWHQTRGIDLRIFTEMMCAGYEQGQRDACVGDSGGPLVINVNGRWTLAGITSAGFGCAQSRQPGIYHRVSHTVDWIKQTIQKEKDSFV